MKLSTKTMWMTGIAMGSLFLALYFVSTYVVGRGFSQLEERYACRNVDRVLRAIEKEGHDLDTSVADWATWDDAYQFVQDRNTNFIRVNITSDSFKALKIHALLIADLFGNVVWSGTYDLKELNTTPALADLVRLARPNSPLTRCDAELDRMSGLITLDDGPMIVAACPILTSKKEGPARGVLIMGRKLDAEAIQRLSTALQFKISAFRVDALPYRPFLNQILATLCGGKHSTIRTLNSTTLAGYGLVRDLDGKPAVVIELEMPRDIFAQGQRTNILFTTTLVLMGALFSVAVVTMLRRQVIARLEQFSRDIDRIAKTQDFSRPILMQGSDELSAVVDDINHLLARVVESRQALATSEERFRQISESVADWIWEIDSTGLYTYASPAVEKILGYKSEEIVGRKHFYDLFTPEEKESSKKAALEMMSRKERFQGLVNTNVHKDGHWVVLESKGVPLVNEDGTLLGYRGADTNITERKRAEESLKESERRLANVIEFLPDATFVIDWEGKVTAWNRAMEEMTGKTYAEMLGKGNYEYTIPFYGERKPILIDIALQSDVEGEKKYDSVHRNGDTLYGEIYAPYTYEGKGGYLWATASVLRDAQGKIVGAIESIRDITERKQAEKALRETNLQLEEATARASQMAVLAEVANATKSEFLANMSHEIRTPMNGIVGMTSLLLSTKLTHEQREYANIVCHSADSLLAIINDILDFSKIEAGKVNLEIIDFDLEVMLDELSDLIAFSAHEKALEYIYVVEPRVPTLLKGDPGRLRQVLLNLIGNAVKFTEKGEVSVTVSLEREDDQQAHIRFEVRDTGIGISTENQSRLFQPFTQADASMTRKYGGTGLGLSISKHLVSLMRGTIDVRSAEGAGSTFWFTVGFEKRTAPQGLLKELPSFDADGPRILFVDDNASSRQVISTYLTSWHGRFSEASDAVSGLEQLYAAVAEGDPFRVAILDMQMPGMSGEELAIRIKRDCRLRDICLVMMIPTGKQVDYIRLQEIGFSEFLSKPVRQSRLHNCLAATRGLEQNSLDRENQRIERRSAATESLCGQHRILIVEDNATNQKVALYLLKKLGYQAETAANGLDAIRQLEIRSYDLVLMDVQMPEMDGLEATAAIRRKESISGGHIPIIAMTACAMKGDEALCLQAGMDDYIPKPIVKQAVDAKLRKWLVRNPMNGNAMQRRHISVPFVAELDQRHS